MRQGRPDGDEIPMTLVAGPLGAGKTTLVNRLLEAPGGRRIAVLVNDFGEVNVDEELLDETAEEGVIGLSNGCICCRLDEDLLTEVTRLGESRTFDYLVIEASGISAPAPIARTLTVGTDGGRLPDRFRLDTVVSVVDAYGFWKAFDPSTSLPAGAPAPDRPLSEVLVDQVEFCDVLLLNKCDMVPDEDLDAVERSIRDLQPRARIHRTTHCAVDPDTVLGTGLFDFEAARREQGWRRRLAAAERDGDPAGKPNGSSDPGDPGETTVDGTETAAETETETGRADPREDPSDHDDGHEHGRTHPVADHDVRSFVYRRDRPFDPDRFDAWLDEWDGAVLRMKGFAWVASRPDEVVGVSRAGPTVRAGPIGEWGEDDPGTRLVFIGADLDREAITARLDGCLVGADDDGSGASPNPRSDPFPREP
jgi:G3E family GTPase